MSVTPFKSRFLSLTFFLIIHKNMRFFNSQTVLLKFEWHCRLLRKRYHSPMNRLSHSDFESVGNNSPFFFVNHYVIFLTSHISRSLSPKVWQRISPFANVRFYC